MGMRKWKHFCFRPQSSSPYSAWGVLKWQKEEEVSWDWNQIWAGAEAYLRTGWIASWAKPSRIQTKSPCFLPRPVCQWVGWPRSGCPWVPNIRQCQIEQSNPHVGQTVIDNWLRLHIARIVLRESLHCSEKKINSNKICEIDLDDACRRFIHIPMDLPGCCCRLYLAS